MILGRKLLSVVSYTNWIIAVNVALFLIFLLLFALKPAFASYIVLTPSLLVTDHYYWTLLTSMFMHAGGFHLFVNMLSLFFLGNLTEKIIGRKRLLMIYFIAGIVGALAYFGSAYLGTLIGTDVAHNVFGEINVSAVGASGAIFGLIGLLAVLVPNFRVFLVAGPIVIIVLQVLITPFLPVQAQGVFGFIMTILMLVSLFGMFSQNKVLRKAAWPIEMPLWVAPIAAIVPLVLISIFVSLPIGNSAHLGGLVAGLIYGAVLRVKYSKKIALLQRMFVRR